MANSKGFPEEKDSEEQCGVVLGYWDQEKTPTVIKDLEESIHLVETKCKKLLYELIYYRKYLEESQTLECSLATLKEKKINLENSRGFFGSDPDLTFRKNLLQSQKFKEIFEENFQAKLLSINKELTNAARKIGLKDNIILSPNEEYLNSLRAQMEDEVGKCWSDVREEFIKENGVRVKAKSDPKIPDIQEFSKITKNELKLYQKLSRFSISRSKGKKMRGRVKISSPVGRKPKVKLGLKKIKPRTRLDGDVEEVPDSKGNKKFKKTDLKSPKNRKNKITVPVQKKRIRSYQSRSPRFHDPHSVHSSRKKLMINDSEIETMCNSLVDAIHNRNSGEAAEETARREDGADLPNLGSFPKRTIPFTAGTSTSKSYNIGANIQQYLSLAKYGKTFDSKGRSANKTVARSTRIPEPKEAGAKDSSSALNSEHFVKDSFEVSQVEHKGKVWISKRCTSSDIRKVRSKYTGSSPESFMGYHKSTMRQYTNGQKSMIKSESKTAYAVGSKIMLSDCRRTDFFEIDKDCDLFQNASGDGTCNEHCAKLKMEWSKVFGFFIDVYRKYTALKEQVANNDSVLSDIELQSLEKEIDFAVGKYKEFLKFYSEFLSLKHRLKTLKIACEEEVLGPVTSFSLNCHKRLDACRPTSSMTMKKAFREVQALQEKIRLVGDF